MDDVLNKNDNPYQSQEFSDRITYLKRRELNQLYPSEAWSLYRTLPKCESVIDLGCGSGDMAGIVNTISPSTRYSGVDSNAKLINIAKRTEIKGKLEFIKDDVFAFLKRPEKFGCVMGWALLYAVENLYKLLEMMIAKANKYVLFDVRAVKTPDDVIDMSVSHTRYGKTTGPLPIVSFDNLINFIKRYEKKLSSVEMAGYYFPIGPHGWVDARIAEPAILSVALEKASPDFIASKKCTQWYIKVPPDLLNDPQILAGATKDQGRSTKNEEI